VRENNDGILAAVMLGFVLTGVAATLASIPTSMASGSVDVATATSGLLTTRQVAGPQTGAQWLTDMRRFCNPVDVVTHMGRTPAPATDDGSMHEAACLALSGRIDSARSALLELPEDERWRGAGVVFNVGHPAADAGDETAAGPLMELVVEFRPNHHMALYHAGAARFESDDPSEARDYLQRFLVHYDGKDGWRRSATQMLAKLDEG
jgi:hypothetical protein